MKRFFLWRWCGSWWTGGPCYRSRCGRPGMFGKGTLCHMHAFDVMAEQHKRMFDITND